ncbi:MAG: hypothetical protein LHW45_08105 [Candidatus Cloacimonetes bacterium]|nr:hypothetical protein [Candidatus Cloacimonadota bacterium]MDY0367572.1 hypothetical protein [Candidatus Syntrophosphaera sp.]
MKQRLANQWKHLLGFWIVATVCGFLHWLILKADPKAQMYLWWFGVWAIFIFALNIERNQFILSGLSLREYLRRKWLDTLLDFICSLAGGILGLLPWWYWSGF